MRVRAQKPSSGESRLVPYLEDGTIWLTGSGEYLGKAADGTEVNLGMFGYEQQIEEYLKRHPTPDTW